MPIATKWGRSCGCRDVAGGINYLNVQIEYCVPGIWNMNMIPEYGPRNMRPGIGICGPEYERNMSSVSPAMMLGLFDQPIEQHALCSLSYLNIHFYRTKCGGGNVIPVQSW